MGKADTVQELLSYSRLLLIKVYFPFVLELVMQLKMSFQDYLFFSAMYVFLLQGCWGSNGYLCGNDLRCVWNYFRPLLQLQLFKATFPKELLDHQIDVC